VNATVNAKVNVDVEAEVEVMIVVFRFFGQWRENAWRSIGEWAND
jgi:hypothetical protein